MQDVSSEAIQTINTEIHKRQKRKWECHGDLKADRLERLTMGTE